MDRHGDLRRFYGLMAQLESRVGGPRMFHEMCWRRSHSNLHGTIASGASVRSPL